MAKSPKSLLDQIEAGALESSTPLADVLRMCVALGGRAGSADLRDWARRELDGYTSAEDGELPAYRKVRAAIRIDGSDVAKIVTGQQISRVQLPDFARDAIGDEAPVPYGVAELEHLATRPGLLRLQHPGMPDLVAYMNAQQQGYGSSIHEMYWGVASTSIVGILDTIRTNLVALVAEMRAAGSDDVPSPEVAAQAVNVVINGAKRTQISINTNQSSGSGDVGGQAITGPSPSTEKSVVPGWIRTPWAFAVGVATVAAGVAGVAVWVGWNPFG